MQKAKAITSLVGVLCLLMFIAGGWAASLAEPTDPAPQQEPTKAPTTTTTAPAPAPETAGGPFYPLTEYERDLVERVVMAEAGGEPFEGQMAVAQCILNASLLRQVMPTRVVVDLKYTKARPEPTKQVKDAVAAVFDDGEAVFDRDVIYFYAPGLVKSAWHESQVYVTTIGCHRFFKEAR